MNALISQNLMIKSQFINLFSLDFFHSLYLITYACC